MKKKVVVSQPGKLGDILITAPMVKYFYDLGHKEIYWPVFDNFQGIVSRFDYVIPVSLNVSLDKSTYLGNKRVSFFDKSVTAGSRSSQFYKEFNKRYQGNPEFDVIDACFAFPGHFNQRNNEAGAAYLHQNKSWIQLKYDLLGVPLRQRWNLDYKRDLEKEEKLLSFIREFARKKYGTDEYSIVHAYQEHPHRPLPKYTPMNPIHFSYIKGYEIVDWLRVLEEASEIVCIDSCLSHFVEVCSSLKDTKKIYLGTEEPHYTPFMNNILFNNWTNLSEADITHGVARIEDL